MRAGGTRVSAFTLIELSIVLVVIGMIIGGVLIGRELIRAAELRATVNQFGQFNAAVNAFRTKYNCLPGDCAAAEQWGFDINSSGDGNGQIGPCDTFDIEETDPCMAEYETASREFLNFWYHLSNAGLIAFHGVPTASLDGILADPRFNANTDPAPNNDGPSFSLSTQLGYEAGIMTPPAGIQAKGARFGWLVRGTIRFATPAPAGASGAFTAKTMPAHNLVLGKSVVGLTMTRDVYNGFQPADISAIDRKIDDGLPLSGGMQTMESKYYANDGAHAQAFTDSGLECGSSGPAGSGARCTCHNGGTTPDQWLYNDRVVPTSRGCVATIHGTF